MTKSTEEKMKELFALEEKILDSALNEIQDLQQITDRQLRYEVMQSVLASFDLVEGFQALRKLLATHGGPPSPHH